MKYALLIYGDETLQPAEGSPEFNDVYQGYYKFTEDITSEGVNRGGEALHNVEAATSVRVRNGEQTVTDGPFAETKEQLGGFYLIEVDDLDAAIGVAAKIPGVNTGTIEIRPLIDFG
ncbi:MAG: YciI family protein [Proteobacteria bacterium]|nr:YciI family protein [Pseudomonadota bacterium]